MRTAQTFSQVTIDPASSSSDFPRGYQVFVSNDAVTWGDPVASGTGGGGLLTIAFPTQTARFVGVVQTGASTSWWSIVEINVYGPGAVPQVALTPAAWVATASSTSGSDVASHVFDGVAATRWSSGVPQANGQSFQVDLLSAQPLTGVAMDSGSSSPSDYARAFQIYATNDLGNWGAPLASGSGTNAFIKTSFATTPARYLKIVLTGSSSSWWSIAELTVYGVGTFTPAATALPRLGWTASASVACASAATPAQALDDDATTRFATCQNQASGQTFVVDMQVARTFTKVTLDAGTFNGDSARAYQVYVSNDGVSFGAPVATGTGATQLITINVPSQTARYVEIVQTGAAPANWWSIAELNVYGLPPVELLRDGWVASASAGASTAAAAIDGNASTRWTTSAPQVSGQWFQLDMRAAQSFNQIVLDATGASSDDPRAYAVYVSNDGASFGAPVATGAGSAAVVSIGFADQTARYVRVVQTSSTSSWWSAFEVNVYASPTIVQIQSYIDRAYYASTDVVSSFVFQGEQIDCIPFAAQHSVKAWLAQGVSMPTTIPAAPPHRPGAPPVTLPLALSFSGQPDVNGRPSQCPSGTVPLSRPTVAQIQAAGGVAAYKQSIVPRAKLLGSRQGVENDCWLNGSATPGGPLLPGDGSQIGSRNATDYDHAVGIQNSGWQPAGAPGFYGMSMATPIYQPNVVMNTTFDDTGLEHTDSQLWVQTGTCDNEYNPIADYAFGESRNQCRLGSACTTCVGADCANCAVQSLEVVSLTQEGIANQMPSGVNETRLQVFITSDGYYSAYCFAGTGRCTGCPSTPGPAGEGSDCFVALPQAPFKPNQLLTPNGGLGAAQYGIVPQDITFSVWNGASTGMPGWWVYVDDEPIGWYPPQAFNWPDGSPGPLGTGVATYAQAGGEVFDTWPGGKHTDTAMVSDNAASAGYKYAAYARNVEYYDVAKTPHDASLTYLVPPASEGDASIPGLCGLDSGGWTDAASAPGAYSLSTTTPPGDASWGTYFYFGGGQLSKEIGPAASTAQPVAILYHQYAACNFVPTNPGAAATGSNAAYVLFAIEGLDNNGLGTIDFHFDPARLYVVDPNTGLRDYSAATPTLQLYRYIIGTDAALAQTVPRNVADVDGALIGYVALIVTTKATDGPSEANATTYNLAYDRQPGDPPVVLFNNSSSHPSTIGQDDCSKLGLSATVTNF
jgi:hypothetical protein